MNKEGISLEFLQNLLYCTAHEFGTKIRHLNSFSDLMLDNVSDRMNEEEQNWLKILLKSGKQADAILQAYSRLSNLSNPQAETEDFSLRPLVDSAVSHYREQIDKTKVNFVVDGDWPNVSGNREHWETLVYCLVENSIVFQPEDDGHQPVINIDCRQQNTNVVLSVADNGIGVPESLRDEITKPFKRINRSDRFPGVGMGLTYCQLIAEMNNGVLNFSDSSLGGLCTTYIV